MRQASETMRDLMGEYFGDRLSEDGPKQYLIGRGYQLTSDRHWLPKTSVDSYGQMTRKEFECLTFLHHEWDYGGLEPARSEA